MKWRENILMKALAFIAAVAAFTATAILGWYQIANFDALWDDEYTGSHGYTLQYLVRRDYSSVSYLVRLYEKRDQGTQLTFSERRALEQFEARYDPAVTNLRWQLLDQDGKFLYGNTREDSTQVEVDFLGAFERNNTDQPGVESNWSHYQEITDKALNAEDYSEPVYNDLWREVLPDLANLAAESQDSGESPLEYATEGMDFAVQPNTILADEDGQTLVLWIYTPDGSYLYYPTVRACLETNQFGYIFDPYSLQWRLAEIPQASSDGSYANLLLWVDKEFRVSDPYKRAADKLAQWQSDKEGYLALTIVLGTTGILLMAYLCCGAGHKRGEEGIYLNWFHRIPSDVLLFFLFMGGTACVYIGLNVSIEGYSYLYAPMYIQLIALGLTVSAAAALGMAALITVCARCKAHTLVRNTWIWAICAWCWRRLIQLMDTAGRASRALPLIWKAVMGCMAYTLFTIMTFTSSGGLWLIVTALAACYLCLWAWQWKKIRHGTQEIIGGNPNYHIDTHRMLPDLRGHADELNNLGHAISAAVEDRMKSEHFKAELITNVSHDLKTPLTSIINYVDLLKKVEIDDPKAAEYIEVLDRKSQRLKKLTEDLVEASKASTGSLTVNWERLDFKQLADQALAECGDRLEGQGLTVVRTLPEEPVWVDADGRHLWRVLDNLLTNCAKYALPGTRVYVDLRTSGSWAVLSVKNISRDALDIPAERLMERFVRGDESRNASGSGLGLSIAQSLTELQHGRFDISIDGDLFKAIVSLPLAGEDGTGLPILRL